MTWHDIPFDQGSAEQRGPRPKLASGLSTVPGGLSQRHLDQDGPREHGIPFCEGRFLSALLCRRHFLLLQLSAVAAAADGVSCPF